MIFCKNILLICFFLSFLGDLSAQHFDLTLVVLDEQHEAAEGAMVVLLSAKDSVMHQFKVADRQGVAAFKSVKSGSYLLQINWVGFGTHWSPLVLEGAYRDTVYLGVWTDSLALTIDAKRMPFRVDGDTIKYAADAYRVQPQDDVEALLKQLPGIEVDKEGTVYAQGRRVQQVLVDGKTFFGHNPKMATQNLSADIVDEVQVYAATSKSTNFTGIDDGVQTQTINLTLKKGQKKGAFGRVEAALAAPDALYKYKGMGNYFTARSQWNVIGQINTLNTSSFSFNDYTQLVGGNPFQSATLSTLKAYTSFLSLKSTESGRGPISGGGAQGLIFGDKDNQWTTYYLFGVEQRREQQNRFGLAPLFGITERQSTEKESKQGRHYIYTKWEKMFSSEEGLDVEIECQSMPTSLHTNTVLARESTSAYLYSRQSFEQKTRLYNVHTRWNYRKRFVGTQNTWITRVEAGYGPQTQAEENNIYSTADSTHTTWNIDRLQQQKNHRTTIQTLANTMYNIQLSGSSYLQVILEGQAQQQRSTQRFWKKQNTSWVESTQANDTLHYNHYYIQSGLVYAFKQKKHTFNLSAQLQKNIWTGQSSMYKVRRQQRTLPLFKGMWRWLPRSGRSLYLLYMTRVQTPTLRQLQAVPQRQLPQQRYQGNPNLRAAYHHVVHMYYRLFDMFSSTTLSAQLEGYYTQNPIVEYRKIDADFIQNIYPTNEPESWEARAGVQLSTSLTALNLRPSVRLNTSVQRRPWPFDSLHAESFEQRYSIRYRLETETTQKWWWGIGGRYTYHNATYTQQAPQHYSSQEYEAELSGNFYTYYSLKAICKYQLWQATRTLPKAQRVDASIRIQRTLGKRQQAVVYAEIHNIFDETEYIYQRLNSMENQQMIAQGLGRYFLVGVKYKFKHTKL